MRLRHFAVAGMALLLAGGLFAAMNINTVLAEADPVDINADTFPDPVWRQYVLSEIDTDKSKDLSESEAAISSIVISGKDIADFKGIEYFPGLTEFSVSGSSILTSLDLSGNTGLRQVSVTDCELIDLSGIRFNEGLLSVALSGNELSDLVFEGPSSLKELDVRDNPLGTLDVSANPGLTSLNCNGCELTALDLSGNTKLESLSCKHNKLTSLDLGKNEVLTSIDCSENYIEDFRYSQNSRFEALYLEQNNIPAADLPDFNDYELSKVSKKFPQRYMTPKYIENLKVTVTTDSSVSLEWEQVDNADGYQIWRAESEFNTGEAELINTVSGKSNTSYTDSGMEKYSKFYYFVMPYHMYSDDGEDLTYTSMDYLDHDYVYHHYINGTYGRAVKVIFGVGLTVLGEGGTAEVNRTTARVDDRITVDATADMGYKVKKITVLTKDGSVIGLDDGDSFEMPEDDVDITVTFEKEKYEFGFIYDPEIIEVKGAPDFRDDAEYGDKYSFTVSILDEDWEICSVEQAGNEMRPDEYGIYTVVQPPWDMHVIITVKEKYVAPGNGWYIDGDGAKYYYRSGEPVKGWMVLDGKQYYLNPKTGIMATGWKKFSNGTVYYLVKSTGAAVKGLKELGGKFYYFDKNCVMQSGWKTVSGKKYYFKLNSDKTKAPAYVGTAKKIGSYYYVFSTKGVMQKSGVKTAADTGDKYYLKSSGKAYTKKWYKKSGKWYYFGSNGKMVVGKSLKIGKKTYKFDKKGVCKNP